MSGAPVVGRFAPTPSGRMHLGNVFAALIAWASVRSQNGEMVLRMEDLDTQRTSGEFAQILRDDLAWLGLDYDRETPPQSLRSDAYDRYFEILRQQGLIYPCYCTRSQLHSVNAPHLSDGTYVYTGTCRNLTQEQRASFNRKPA
jgi:glutamyl-tRNA synthetase